MARLLADRRAAAAWIKFASAAALAAVVGGCGWTPRDEFYLSRREVVHATPGDGSRVTFGGAPTIRSTDASDAEIVWSPPSAEGTLPGR